MQARLSDTTRTLRFAHLAMSLMRQLLRSPKASMRSWIFSYTRGTPKKSVGCTCRTPTTRSCQRCGLLGDAWIIQALPHAGTAAVCP